MVIANTSNMPMMAREASVYTGVAVERPRRVLLRLPRRELGMLPAALLEAR